MRLQNATKPERFPEVAIAFAWHKRRERRPTRLLLPCKVRGVALTSRLAPFAQCESGDLGAVAIACRR